MEWIETYIGDDLPDIGERVLVYDNGGLGVLTGRLGFSGWYLEGDKPTGNENITHWMPLPEPPNE